MGGQRTVSMSDVSCLGRMLAKFATVFNSQHALRPLFQVSATDTDADMTLSCVHVVEPLLGLSETSSSPLTN